MDVAGVRELREEAFRAKEVEIVLRHTRELGAAQNTSVHNFTRMRTSRNRLVRSSNSGWIVHYQAVMIVGRRKKLSRFLICMGCNRG